MDYFTLNPRQSRNPISIANLRKRLQKTRYSAKFKASNLFEKFVLKKG